MHTKNIYFDVQHLYYLPQFLPVMQQLKNSKASCTFIFYTDNTEEKLIDYITEAESISAYKVENTTQSLEIYQQQKPDWIIFGNAFPALKSLDSTTRTALLYHGIGIKECYYDTALAEMQIRFTEGPYRSQELLRRHPDIKIYESGFAKLDPLVNKQNNSMLTLSNMSLDTTKKTILYAPTFYPSSIENMPENWPELLADYNIVIKPHQFSMTNARYKKQRERLLNWSQYNNVYLASDKDYSLVPFMDVADILISEASSALFEFAALGKPVIWCDFIKLRWNYRGLFKYRYTKRMDTNILRYQNIARHIKKPSELKLAIEDELQHPENFQQKRQQYSNELLGTLDGKASSRISRYLLEQ